MVGSQGSLSGSNQAEQQHSHAADEDVWTQLRDLASRDGADPVLHLLVSEAISRIEELRGVTATIASRYRALVDAIPDAVIIHDESGNVLDANEAASRLFRQEHEALLRSSLQELNPGLEAGFLSTLHGASGKEQSLTASSTFLGEDGTRSDRELHAREYLDGGRIRIITVIRDLGPREASIQQLQDSANWLRVLMYSIDKGVIVWSRSGRIVSANPAACRALQMSEAELQSLKHDQLDRWGYFDASGHPTERSALPWVRALETGKPQESVICGIELPGEGSTLWLAISAVPQTDGKHAEPDKAACVFTEVTTLQRDAMMFAQVQTLNNVGAWQLDFESQVLHCSSHMHMILDVPMSTPITRERLLGHFAGQDLDRFRLAFSAAREGRAERFEALLTTSIGRKRHVRIRVRPLFDGARVIAVFGTLRDITTDPPNPSPD